MSWASIGCAVSAVSGGCSGKQNQSKSGEPAPVRAGAKEDEMDKENAIEILENAGWVIGHPEEIEVEEAREGVIFLSQEGNGEWIVTEGGSVTFFETEDE